LVAWYLVNFDQSEGPLSSNNDNKQIVAADENTKLESQDDWASHSGLKPAPAIA
jgi:hypothetical protein